jgi:hypothetical protein
MIAAVLAVLAVLAAMSPALLAWARGIETGIYRR